MKKLITLSILFITTFLLSCSSSNDCTENKNYGIEYYSGGGFTGLEQGVTIHCSGSVQFWEKKLNLSRELTDSLTLSDEQIKGFSTYMDDPGVFSYTHEFSGNMTAHLTFTKKDKSNSISFNPTELPQDMPSPIKNILSEIKNINNK